MRWYQLFVIIFGLIMLYFTFLDHKRRTLKTHEWFFFSLIWFAGIILAFIPQSSQLFFQTFMVARILDFVTIAGIVLLSALVYRIYIKTKKTEKRLEDLTRKDALKDLKKQ